MPAPNPDPLYHEHDGAFGVSGSPHPLYFLTAAGCAELDKHTQLIDALCAMKASTATVKALTASLQNAVSRLQVVEARLTQIEHILTPTKPNPTMEQFERLDNRVDVLESNSPGSAPNTWSKIQRRIEALETLTTHTLPDRCNGLEYRLDNLEDARQINPERLAQAIYDKLHADDGPAPHKDPHP